MAESFKYNDIDIDSEGKDDKAEIQLGVSISSIPFRFEGQMIFTDLIIWFEKTLTMLDQNETVANFTSNLSNSRVQKAALDDSSSSAMSVQNHKNKQKNIIKNPSFKQSSNLVCFKDMMMLSSKQLIIRKDAIESKVDSMRSIDNNQVNLEPKAQPTRDSQIALKVVKMSEDNHSRPDKQSFIS